MLQLLSLSGCSRIIGRRRFYRMGKRTNVLVVAAVAGLAIGVKAPAQEANAGQPAEGEVLWH